MAVHPKMQNLHNSLTQFVNRLEAGEELDFVGAVSGDESAGVDTLFVGSGTDASVLLRILDIRLNQIIEGKLGV